MSSDYLLFMSEQIVWPKSIEIEGTICRVCGPARWAVAELKSTYDATLVERYRKLVGTWNAVRIVSNGGEVKV